MNPDGMVALLNYREDGTTRECLDDLSQSQLILRFVDIAYFTFWKDGVKEIKL